MASVVTILDSGFAAGFIKVSGQARRGVHEPLIDEATWTAYQRERDRRRRDRPKGQRQRRWYLGGGLTVCERCDGNMVINSYAAKDSMAICSTYRVRQTCAGTWIRRATVELIVNEWLGEHLSDWADEQDRVTGIDDERARLAKELANARADERRLDDGRREALRLVQRGLASEREFEETTRDLEDERRAITDRIAVLGAQLDALAPDADVLDRLERGMDGGFVPEEFNALLKRLIRRVVVAKDTVTVEPWWGEPTAWNRR
jgi:hypothetical protein